MKTIRRFYFYLISLISIQLIIWSVVNLLRTIFDGQVLISTVDWLAGGIAFVVVGVPIFLIHWRVVQRDALEDEEEETSRIRALFLYAMPLATGIPVTYALLAIFNRIFNRLLGLPVTLATLGGSQSDLDNLIAILVNLIVLVYFWRVLQRDWKKQQDPENLVDYRRLYRYIWMVYGLGLLVFGALQLLRYIFYNPQDFGKAAEAGLSTGLALVLVGLPVFWKTWQIIQTSLTSSNDQRSSLRLSVLFILTFLGIGFSLGALGILLTNGFRWFLSVDTRTLSVFIDQNANPLAVGITLGVVWLYFRQKLNQTIQQQEGPFQKAHLQRVFHSILSFAGLVVTFLGLMVLLGFMIETVFNQSLGKNSATLSDAFAFLLVGTPLWLNHWRKIQFETSSDNELGVEARKSLIRKIYLYLALFATVVGSMLSTGWWIYGILKALLDQMPANFWLSFFMQLRLAVLFSVLLMYHLRVLRSDGRAIWQPKSIAEAQYSVVVVYADDLSLTGEIVTTIQNKHPQLSCSSYKVEPDSPSLEIPAASLMIIHSNLMTHPSVQTAIHSFSGKILIIPQQEENIFWLGSHNDKKQILQDVANTVQQLSKNQIPQPATFKGPWLIVVYILAGLFALEIVALAITALVNLFL